MITQKVAKEWAEILADELGKKFDDCWDPETKKAIIGCWKLDCNPYYGGCIIEEIQTEGGGVTTPTLHERLTPREFVNSVKFTLNVLDDLKKRGILKFPHQSP